MPAWLDEHAEELRGQTVLMYCTGGVRCERVSVYLRQKGPGFARVFQLSGGVQRYLEAAESGALQVTSDLIGKERGIRSAEVDDPAFSISCIPSRTEAHYTPTLQHQSDRRGSLWIGQLLVFDGRNAVAHSGAVPLIDDETRMSRQFEPIDAAHFCSPLTIVGRCLICAAPFDFYCGLRCGLCGVLVLICPTCKPSVVECHVLGDAVEDILDLSTHSGPMISASRTKPRRWHAQSRDLMCKKCSDRSILPVRTEHDSVPFHELDNSTTD